MSNKIDEEKLESLAKELAKGVKTEQDLADLSRTLLKMTVETALGAEMEAHLGYAPHEAKGRNSGNSRNGHSTKGLKGDHGEVQITTPRDRDGSFEPQIVRKGQTRLTQFDDQILSLYAKGMSTRDIVAAFQEMYGAEVSPTLVSKVTEAVPGAGRGLAVPAPGGAVSDRVPGRPGGQSAPGQAGDQQDHPSGPGAESAR